jgi:hypothetical protein
MAIVLPGGASSPIDASSALCAVRDEGQEIYHAMHDAELVEMLVTAS